MASDGIVIAPAIRRTASPIVMATGGGDNKRRVSRLNLDIAGNARQRIVERDTLPDRV